MAGDLSPESVLHKLEEGQLSPLYLFYGPSEFRLEKTLAAIRENFIPESVRDLNLQVFYVDKGEGGRTGPAEIIDAARTLPFMSSSRRIIVRRVEGFAASTLEAFLPYLHGPSESTCLIFAASKPDFRLKFYKKIRELGAAVYFGKLSERQVVPWIKERARELGLSIPAQACAYLQQIVGNRLTDLYSELEKLHLRYGETTVGIEEVKELAIYSRIYSIFELMDEVSSRRRVPSILVLKRFLEEEGKDGAFRILGMLNRQIRLIWGTKSVIEKGGRSRQVAQELGLRPFQVKRLMEQVIHWRTDDLERALHLLYQADGLLKSGAHGNLVLENLVLGLCG